MAVYTFTFVHNVSKKEVKIKASAEWEAWMLLEAKLNPKGIPCLDLKKIWHLK